MVIYINLLNKQQKQSVDKLLLKVPAQHFKCSEARLVYDVIDNPAAVSFAYFLTNVKFLMTAMCTTMLFKEQACIFAQLVNLGMKLIKPLQEPTHRNSFVQNVGYHYPVLCMGMLVVHICCILSSTSVCVLMMMFQHMLEIGRILYTHNSYEDNH